MYKQDTKTGGNYWTEIKYKKTPTRLAKPDKKRVFYFLPRLVPLFTIRSDRKPVKRTCQNGINPSKNGAPGGGNKAATDVSKCSDNREKAA